jgi:hypothetical protein
MGAEEQALQGQEPPRPGRRPQQLRSEGAARLSLVHSSTDDAAIQIALRRSDERQRQERAPRNLVEFFAFGAPGGHQTWQGWAPPLRRRRSLGPAQTAQCPMGAARGAGAMRDVRCRSAPCAWKPLNKPRLGLVADRKESASRSLLLR